MSNDDSHRDPRRRFNAAERRAMLAISGGICPDCGDDLKDGWHADHTQPHSQGGATSLLNGRATCPSCNNTKGTSLLMEPETTMDAVELRPFQQELADRINERIAAGKLSTVGWVAAGSGKTLGWMHAANDLYRRGLIDGVVCLVPRLTLRNQAESDWDRDSDLYSAPKMGKIACRDNPRPSEGSRPITEHWHFGYVTTYQSLVTQPHVHLEWAANRSRRFLLVCDEAQFLGSSGDGDQEEGGGTLAAGYVRQLAELALHTVLLTGTPLRSDRKPLVEPLAHYSDEPDSKGERHLQWDVRATYLQGVAGGYLRDLQYDLSHGRGRFSDGEGFDVSSLENHLGVVLNEPRVWHGLVDSAVARLRDVRRRDRRYQGLVCAGMQSQAEAVMTYISKNHPDLRPVLSISKQNGTESNDALKNFKNGHGDILVTVSKAYIGYDCPQITVVALLTSRRWEGYLQQIVARGLRMWRERPKREQTCFVVGPADPRLVTFCEDMRTDAEHGMKERAEREGPDGEGPGGPDPDPLSVDDYEPGGLASKGMHEDQDLTESQRRRIAEVRETEGLVDGEARLVGFLRAMGYTIEAPKEDDDIPEPRRAPETEEEARSRLSADCSRIAAKYILLRRPDLKGTPDFKKAMRTMQAQANKAVGLPATGGAKRASVPQMESKRQFLLSMMEQVTAPDDGQS